MWKRPALWAALSGLTLCPPAARGGDVGETASFSRSLSFAVAGTEGPGDVLFDSGESAFISVPWDTVIFQGRSPDDEVDFEAARKDAAGVWTPWVKAAAKRHPGGRFWAKASFSRAAGAVRVRAVATGLASGHSVALYGVEVFSDSGERQGRAAGPLARPGEEPPGKPLVHGRESWGAKPPKEPFEADVPRKLTVHHTSGPQPANLDEAKAEAAFIQDFHQNGRKWNDIAYHFLIDAAGNVLEGRPLGVLGAHTLGNNPGNVGVALLGTHHAPQNHPLSKEKRAAFVALGRWLERGHHVPSSSLKGHRDYKSTDCPGDLIYPLLDAFKREISAPEPARPVAPGWLKAHPAWDGRASVR